jgi:hypothetical protein
VICQYLGTNELLKQSLCFCPSCARYRQVLTPETCATCDKFEEKKDTPPAASDAYDFIEATLPPRVDWRDRKFQVFSDGSIVYERLDGQPPPLDIDGYTRDPANDHRFMTDWPKCALRYEQAIRKLVCGCINVIMRCNNPKHPKYKDRVSCEDCKKCLTLQ